MPIHIIRQEMMINLQFVVQSQIETVQLTLLEQTIIPNGVQKGSFNVVMADVKISETVVILGNIQVHMEEDGKSSNHYGLLYKLKAIQ